ncbi:hypothetical protein ANCCEY_01665 [Ancylostoma ceylanicum]|uniref:Uncharacterized protein n=1 Tax=Ancylostoma ceylanicum TaxID=53326 RepID=A0A0D6MCN9_9BILA|nr:hypothetical protein ANCCEY_01665 [Ancylostoma ceylanicum]
MRSRNKIVQDCSSSDASQPITKVDNGSVTLIKGYEKFKCKARCLFHERDRKYKGSEWRTIKKTKFPCDFIETDCKFQNVSKKYIHMQIEEKKSPKEMSVLKRENYPDVHLIVLDSVASSQLIRALPRTANFLLNGMDAVQFRKLNRVGDNSRPNGFVTLLGKTTEPVVRTLMKLKTIEPDLDYTKFCSNYIDDKTYIPVNYRSAGYKHALSVKDNEELPEQFICEAFIPCTVVAKYANVQKSARLSERNRRSMGESRENLKQNSPKFSLSWIADLAHNDAGGLYKGDYALYNFFFKNRKALSNSFIFFFGDHGGRFGRIFDENSRGSSLLRRFQAEQRRNCKTLPIPFQYCICQYEKKDVTDNALKQSLGQFAAKELASFLETQNVSSTCEEIKLQKAVEAKQYLSTKIKNLGSNTSFFEVTFEVAAPAKGKFQIPIRKEQGHLNLEGALFQRMDRLLGASVEDRLYRENADLFDYCPFEIPDPWHKSIAQYVDVKYGFETNIT